MRFMYFVFVFVASSLFVAPQPPASPPCPILIVPLPRPCPDSGGRSGVVKLILLRFYLVGLTLIAMDLFLLMNLEPLSSPRLQPVAEPHPVAPAPLPLQAKREARLALHARRMIQNNFYCFKDGQCIITQPR